jgi:hypothetical protein
MKCENCGTEHQGIYGSGRFCSIKCSRGFSTKAKRKEINEIVSKKLTKYNNLQLVCKYCHKKFTSKKIQNCCSYSCSSKLRGGWRTVKKTSEEWSIINKRSYLEGKRVGGGKTKWFNYKNIRVQGTFELRTCKILDIWKEQGKIQNWEYTKDRIEYISLDKKIHTYLLDFKIWDKNDNWYYLEIKGYKHPNDDLKWQSVRNKGFNLEIWFKKDIIEKENNL